MADMRLALFDLDHTLLPLDSDVEWSRFLSRIGAVDGALRDVQNERYARDYHEGRLDIAEFLAFQLAPLAQFEPAELDAMHRRFMREVIEPAIRREARALVERHQAAGDLCAIVTATNEFITGPIAAAFGLEHLIATEVERVDGRYTGRPRGLPSYREGTVVRTRQWLAGLGLSWEGFEASWFYSDSMNDVPLFERVDHPVATNPDAALAALAAARGWPVLRLFE